MGAGAMTGRGLGSCIGAGYLSKGAGLGLGLGLGMACGRGFGRGFGMAYRRGFGRGAWRFPATGAAPAEDRRVTLQAQKDALKDRLAAIDKQLEIL